MYIYIYIYVALRAPARGGVGFERGRWGFTSTVSFHNFKSQNFKLSVSNPKSNMLLICPYCLKFQIARV